MQSDRKPERGEEIEESVEAEEIEDRSVIGENDCRIDVGPTSTKRNGALEPREPRDLQKSKTEEPQRFPVPTIADEARLEVAGKIGIVIVIAEMRMVLLVVAAKAHRGWESVRQVGDDRDPFVAERRLEDRVVNGIVDDDEHGVIGEGADAIGPDDRKPPISQPEMAEKGGQSRLAEHDGNGDDCRHRIIADEG